MNMNRTHEMRDDTVGHLAWWQGRFEVQGHFDAVRKTIPFFVPPLELTVRLEKQRLQEKSTVMVSNNVVCVERGGGAEMY